MLRLIAAASVALLFAGAGVARADDCTRMLAAGSGRPLWLTGSFTEADADVNLSWLSANGHLANVHYAQSASPTLVTRPDGRAEVVMWLRGAIVAEYRGARRVLVPQVAFPGSRGVAAAESADGTITLLYASGSAAVIQRITPDGNAGAANPVAQAIDRDAPFGPLLAVDAQGTVFGAVPSMESGIAVRWPVGEAPQLFPSAALLQDADAITVPAVKPDGRGGAWLLENQIAIAHVGATGLTTKDFPQTAQWVAAPAVDRDGDAVLAWSGVHHVIVRHLTAAGVFGPATVMPSRDAYAVALDPRTGDPWVLAHADSALVLQRPGRTVPIRAPRPFEASRGAVAIDASGRAWVVLEGSDDRWNRACHDPVRWATFGLHARHVTSLRLNTEQRRDTT